MSDGKNRRHAYRCFFILKFKFGGRNMSQMKEYVVVRSREEKDEKFTSIHAMSLDEASAIFKVRHKAEEDAMEVGEAFYIFQAEEQLTFDENHRLVSPTGDMCIIQKL